MARRPDPKDPWPLLRIALSEVAGAAIVLDADLRIVDATEEAARLVGSELPVGVRAAQLLCGTGPERPVAEALAEGRPVAAHVRRPSREGGDHVVQVRTIPLSDDDERVGWLLLLDEEEWESSGPDAPVTLHGILTHDPAMKRLLRDVKKVARSEASVLVRGETGAGKELVARAIHLESRRATGPFRAINCAAVPAPLLESELFGHVRGAFTGAVRDAEGHVRLANGGTLFLDEVAELPLELQAKLLRVIQERIVLPVGAREAIPVDVRFVAATHRSLRREVEAGRFRADLMYRLRVVPVFLPPLRERKADISLLARHFVDERNKTSERAIQRISPGACDALEAYEFPGNVRELQNAVEYAFVMGEGPILTETELPPEMRGEEPGAHSTVNEPATADAELPAEARRLLRALDRAGGNKERAARILGISRVTLWRKLKGLGLLEQES
jgi:transcriptional regulator with PAS, ATPase and Fis domain